MKLKENICKVAASILLEFCVLLAMILIQQNILISFPLLPRAILMIAIQWLLLVVPFAFVIKGNEKLSDYGFSKKKLLSQIITGVVIALAMSFVLTVLPIMAGFKEQVGSTSYTEPWQFCYQFAYMILGVALAEEFFYRGFLFQRLLGIRRSKWFAMLLSSAVFGLSHIFGGNMLQVVTTSLFGFLLCLCRDRVKNCTTVSLVIAHGVHNALITVFVAIL